MINLIGIRRDAGVTQVELAHRLRMTQGAVSQTERRADLKLSTLVDYLAVLGATVRVTITVNDEVYDYDLTEGRRR